MPTLENKEEVPIGVKAASFLSIKKQISTLESEKKKLQPILVEYSSENGTKNEKGHINCVVSHNGVKINLYQECRMSASVIPEVLTVLRENISPELYSQLVEDVPTLKEEVFEQFLTDGTIGVALRNKLLTTTDSYAFKPGIVK